MSDFFPDPAEPPDEPEHEQEWRQRQPGWESPPDDVLPGIVPVELIIGRSEKAAVMLIGMRAFPTGLAMTLLARTRVRIRRFDLFEEIHGEPDRDDHDEEWRRDRLKWGFEYPDGRRATNVDAHPHLVHPAKTPNHPVLIQGDGGGDDRAVDGEYWLWPLPPTGPMKVVCQWPRLGIRRTTSHLDAHALVGAATRAQPIW